MFLRFGLVRKALIGVSVDLVKAEYPPSGRERPGNPDHWERMDRIAKVFMHAFCAMLEEPALWNARFIRDTMIAPFRGVSVEGIAMGLTVAEMTTPFSRVNHALELAEDLDGRQRILAYVGIGMALGRLNRDPRRYWPKMHPGMRDLVLDGYGFANGFFRRKKAVDRRWSPRRLSDGDLKMFDHGLGRLIWISSGGDARGVAETLRGFGERQHALWGGVGLACTYAGVCDRAGYETLNQLAGEYRPALIRGSAMACYQLAADQYVADHSEVAARTFWGAPVLEVAARAGRHLREGSDALGGFDFAHACERLERDALALPSSDTRRETVHTAAETETADA